MEEEAGEIAEPIGAEEILADPPGEPEPAEIAEFLIDAPAMAALSSETPYLESWLELSSGPAMADLQLQNGSYEPLSRRRW